MLIEVLLLLVGKPVAVMFILVIIVGIAKEVLAKEFLVMKMINQPQQIIINRDMLFMIILQEKILL
jgi:hypothetical protein